MDITNTVMIMSFWVHDIETTFLILYTMWFTKMQQGQEPNIICQLYQDMIMWILNTQTDSDFSVSLCPFAKI